MLIDRDSRRSGGGQMGPRNSRASQTSSKPSLGLTIWSSKRAWSENSGAGLPTGSPADKARRVVFRALEVAAASREAVTSLGALSRERSIAANPRSRHALLARLTHGRSVGEGGQVQLHGESALVRHICRLPHARSGRRGSATHTGAHRTGPSSEIATVPACHAAPPPTGPSQASQSCMSRIAWRPTSRA